MKILAERIRGAHQILVSTHMDPDGDGIGALLALTLALRRAGTQVYPILPEPCPHRFLFLDPDRSLTSLPDDAEQLGCPRPDLALIVDTHQWSLVGRVGELLRAAEIPTLFLDHHPMDGDPREDVRGDATASSTGELVYRLLHSFLDLPIDARVGECLYASIAYDTHSFRYVRNSPSPHLVAADLLSRGVDATRVYRHLFASNPVGKIRLLGRVLEAVRIEEMGQLAWAELPFDWICQHDVAPDEFRDAVNHLLEIDGVEVAFMLKEVGRGKIKVSLRSKGRVGIREVAQSLGGGGHPFAAGATLHGDLAKARTQVIQELAPVLLRHRSAGCDEIKG